MDFSWHFLRRAILAALWIMSGAALVGSTAQAGAPQLATDWVDGQKSRVRLFAGSVDGRPYGFLEIELLPGWKTYWRNPGDAGGLPPQFDWSASADVAASDVLFPTPIRMVDEAGDTIGYKGRVTFPVELKRSEDKAGSISVTAQYGICKDVCIPVEAMLELDLPAGTLPDAGDAGREALAAVPRAQSKLLQGDPVVDRFECSVSGGVPRIAVAATFPGGGTEAEVFLDASGGVFVPHPLRTNSATGDKVSFEAKIGDGVDVEALKGRTLTATLVGHGGASSAMCEAR